MNPVGLLAEIDAAHHIGDLRKDNDFLIVFTGLDLVRDEIKRQPVKDDVVPDRQNSQKRQRGKSGDQSGEQAIIMRQGMEPRSGGTAGTGSAGAEKEIAGTDQENRNRERKAVHRTLRTFDSKD